MLKKSTTFKILICTVIMLTGVVIFSGCGKKGSEKTPFGLPDVSSAAGSSSVSSASSSKAASSASSKPSASSYAKLDDESFPAPAHSEAPLTSNEDFNRAFESNPIDKAYKSASKEAVSTKDMVTVITEFITVWDKEINFAYKKLLTLVNNNDYATVEKEESDWRGKLDSAVQEIRNSVDPNEGGSIGQVTAGIKVMEYYKARAVALYQQIYAYNTNLTYAYNG